jgi:hypothetical protein
MHGKGKDSTLLGQFTDLEAATNEEYRALEILAEAYKEKGEVVFDSNQMQQLLGSQGISLEVVDSLKDAGEKTRDLIRSMADNETAIVENTKALAKGINSDNKDYNSLSKED